MAKRSKLGAIIVVLAALLCCLPLPTKAQTINAATCSNTDVQTALNGVKADGATVNIPAGTCTWTTTVTYSQSFAVNILGAGSQSIVGGGDVTVIVDGVSHSPTDNPTLTLSAASNKVVRLSGITFQGSSSVGTTYNGMVRFSGPGRLRVDHVHFTAIAIRGFSFNNTAGVFDHDVFDGQQGNMWIAYGNRNTHGDDTWAAPTALGSAQFMYFEDDVFNNASNDCYDGGKWVIRHSTFNAGSTQSNQVLTHPTGGSGRSRGCRAWELYQNTFNNTTGVNLFNVFFLSSGTGVIWGNSAPKGFQNFLSIHSMRRNNGTYPQSATPSGWGYCGTSFNGTGSGWDQNSSSTTGYACLDQPGRGQGDLLANDFPSAINTVTNTLSWPHQAREPIYEWLNVWAGSGSYWSNYDPEVLVQDQDFYLYSLLFNGTSGMGSGLLATRPSTCTQFVGYWATDTNTLYQCSSTNTWTVYYTPYTYPHPLTGSSGTPPLPPTGLAAIVN